VPLPDLRPLLDRLDRSHHADRVRTMALVGRDGGDDPALGELLDEVAAQSEYHHHLALVAASAAGDVQRLVAALRHLSRRIRARALASLGSEVVPAGEIVEAMLQGSAEDRRLLRRFVNRRHLTAIAEAAIDGVRRELGDENAAALLATCTGDTVRRLLPELLYAVPSLRPLARHHPMVLLDHLDEQLPGLPRRQRDQVWTRFSPALAGLALVQPDRLLRLAEQAGPSWVVPHGLAPVMRFLIRFDPARVARLVVQDEFVKTMRWQRLPSALLRGSGHFAKDDQVAIARAVREQEPLLSSWIGSLAPSRRAEVFARALDDLDTSNRVWSPGLLEVLPHEVRHAEARRILQLRTVRESEDSTLRYRAYLPFSEAREQLVAEVRRTRAEDRARGYHLLVSCACRERSAEVMTEALGLCTRLRNEQDPVRLTAFQALAASPARLFDDGALGVLGPLVQEAIAARDTSWGTFHTLNELAFGLLRDASAEPASPRFRFVLDLLDRLSGQTGSPSFPRLDHLLPRGSESALVDALMPRLERASKLDHHQVVLSLAQSLGKRAWRQDALQSLLQRATTVASDSVVRTALALWLADPRTRSTRVAVAVAHDESTLAIPAVLDAVVRSRQDLLDVLLEPRPLHGRFLTGEVRYVPVIASGFERWLPRQCEAYRAALDSLIATRGTADWTRIAAIHALARLPGIGAAALEPHLASRQVPIQEAALAGLAWTDEPGHALEPLLAHAGTDRARVAVYAATRCARFVPRSELLGPLEAILTSDTAKITAKKEAARLLRAHRPPGAVDLLVELASGDQVHRDVRLAISRSLRGQLDDDRAWQLLAALPERSDDEALSLLETGPEQLAPRHRSRYAGLVLATCRSTTPRVRNGALAALAPWARWSTLAPAVACGAIDDLDTGPEWRSALGALATMLQDSAGWPEASDLVTALVDRTDDPALDAGAERDRPSTQRLQAVLRTMAELPWRERSEQRDDLLRVASLVGHRADLVPDHLTIRLAATDWTSSTTALAAIALRLDSHLLLISEGMEAVDHALGQAEARWGLHTFDDTIDHLIGLGTAGSGAVALQLVKSVADRFDWPEPCRARLRTLRAHPVADLAVLATRVLTHEE
jgi:hypothetical protein